MKKTKICFHVLNAYSLFDVKTKYYFGGAEFRSNIFATSLAGYPDMEVFFITSNHLQYPVQKINGVTVLSDWYYKSTGDYSSFFSQILNKVYSTYIKVSYYIKVFKNETYEKYLKEYWLRKVDADYYATFSITSTSLEVADFCLANKKKYLHFFASDNQVKPENFERTQSIINKAKNLFAQNQFQHQALKELFHADSIVLNNPLEIKPEEEAFATKNNKTILWIGRTGAVKRPSLYIELAKLNPDKKFIMICNNSDEAEFKQIQQSIPANLTLHESLSLKKTEEVISKAYIFVSTSKEEGFPNTFLQAGNNAIPVLSISVDPNNYLTSYNCGKVCSDSFQNMHENLNALYANEDLYKTLSTNHYRYVSDFHDEKKIVQTLHTCLKRND